jgi:mediator of RNA polymerase II transcription subunit 7
MYLQTTMADSQPLPIAPFAGPPPFWKHFSTTNLSSLESLKTDAASSNTSLDLKALPLELRYLLPPPLPSKSAGTYTTFHQSHVIDPTSALLSATANIPVDDLANLLITPTSFTNIPAALKSLTSSLLLTFLQLTQLLSQDPTHESRYELLEHSKMVFVNIHVLINSYRPHQAREGVVNMLKDKIDDARAEIRESQKLKERVEGFLRGLEVEQQARAGQRDGTNSSAMSAEEEKMKRMWRIIRSMGDEGVVQDG